MGPCQPLGGGWMHCDGASHVTAASPPAVPPEPESVPELPPASGVALRVVEREEQARDRTAITQKMPSRRIRSA